MVAHRLEQCRRLARAGRAVAGHDRDARLGQSRPRPPRRAARRRGRRRPAHRRCRIPGSARARPAIAAVMAEQPAAQAMVHQPGAAVRAAQAMAAGAAEGERGEAAPVEEQERLLAGRQGLHERIRKRRRQPGTARRPVAAQVDQGHLRHRRTAMARRQQQRRRPLRPARARRSGPPPGGLQRRRRRDQHGRAGLEARPRDRHVAALVGDAVLLLEAGVVLLVDHDQAEIGERQEQGRARADHDRLAALGDPPPGAPARARAELGMPHGGRPAEAAREALQQLRRERDLRQQHQHLAALPEDRGDRLEIDLGLAGAGHAFQQGDAMAARASRRKAPAPPLPGSATAARERARPRRARPRPPAAVPAASRPASVIALTTPALDLGHARNLGRKRGTPSASAASTRCRAGLRRACATSAAATRPSLATGGSSAAGTLSARRSALPSGCSVVAAMWRTS